MSLSLSPSPADPDAHDESRAERADDDERSREDAHRGALAGVAGSGIVGLYGRPFLALDELLGDVVSERALSEVHDDVCLALAKTPAAYTGGSHRSMGIMPASRTSEAVVDYLEVLRALDDAQWATFVSLADDAADYAGVDRADVGEERQAPLSRAQMIWLKVRFGVYFPWKVYLELIPNRLWTDKARLSGKKFTSIARALLPKTVALVERLPFAGVGRCNIMGLEAHDHGTVHRDGDPREQRAPDEFIALCPGPEKRLFIWDEREQRAVVVSGAGCRAYWFNDFDYHGVEAAPFFRYSIRVDGPFLPAFRERIRAACGGARS